MQRERERMQHFQALLMLERVIELAEHLYERTSEIGVPYADSTRVGVAQALCAARLVIYDEIGANKVQERGQGAWPFTNSGEVKL